MPGYLRSDPSRPTASMSGHDQEIVAMMLGISRVRVPRSPEQDACGPPEGASALWPDATSSSHLWRREPPGESFLATQRSGVAHRQVART